MNGGLLQLFHHNFAPAVGSSALAGAKTAANSVAKTVASLAVDAGPRLISVKHEHWS